MVRIFLFLLCVFPLCTEAQEGDTLIWKYSTTDSFAYGSIQYHQFKSVDDFRLNAIEHQPTVLQSSYYYQGGKVILQCDKIATFCEIDVNGVTALRTNNYFHPWEVDITSYLKKGDNHIQARFMPAVEMGLEKHYNYTHPAPNDEGEVEIASLVRKPQHMFGWDFAPRMNLMGFIAPVVIKRKQDQFQNPYVKTISLDSNYAIIERSIEVINNEINEVQWQIKDEQRTVIPQAGRLSWIDTLYHPNLWKAGEINELYNEYWILAADSFTFSKHVNYGVRKVELVQTPDSLGTPFYFKLNNEFVFCKGFNLVPLDIFPTKVTTQRIKALVLDAKEANMNMLRVWGGGDYLPEYFYHLCDSLGIMVWQDFMFACAMYPSDTAFLNSVETEAIYQVKRLRQHPSVVYFNGNNEVEVAWKNWGFQGQEKYNLTEKAQLKIVEGYDKIFKVLLKDVVALYADIPYEHTSPLSNWGTAENFDHGTMHYWGVWHGNDSLQEFWKQIGRFNAEFGFQSFPSPYAIRMVTVKENWSLENTAIQARQKSYIGSAKIEAFIQREFGKYEGFSDFVYKSQLVQAKGVGGALIAQRLQSPACGGSLFWQMNDCWEAPTWSAIDYHGERKALYYAAKEVFAPQTVVRDPNHPSDFYFLQEDIPEENQALELKYYSFDGQLLHRTNYPLTAQMKQQVRVEDSLGDFLVITLGEKSFEFILKNEKREESLENSTIEIVALAYDDETGRGTLTFKANTFVEALQFYSEKYPLIFAENFNHFLPGKYSLEFEIRMPVKGLDKEDIYFHYIKR